MDLLESATASPEMERHPWERARWAFFSRVLRGAGLPRRGAAVLDVGAGDGWLAEQLARAAGVSVVCLDPGYATAPPPGRGPAVTFTASPPPEQFDLVLLLDVCEHVDDDRGFLREVARERVAPGGAVLLSVPAWPALFSTHDERLGHRRRYTRRTARALLEAAGLEPTRAGGLFHALLAARAGELLLRGVTRRAPGHAGGWRAPAAVTLAARGLLAADAAAALALSAVGVDVPGLSWWALCRRS
jgi:SAM-dependent methyltransferase